MEQSSAPEQPSPEAIRPTFVPPPGLEFARGLALFALTMLVFFVVQTGVFMAEVIAHSPELSERGFHFGLLKDPAFHTLMEGFITHGDVVSAAALWSGIAALLFLLVAVRRWKGARMAGFLGLQSAKLPVTLRWLGIFLLLALAIDILGRSTTAFDTDFMEKILATTSQRWKLILGVGIVAPLFEEFLLRGLFYGSLRHMLDEHKAIAITAGVFALMHLQYEWTIMLLILPMGVVLGYARSRSGSIWVAVLLHMINNTVSIFIP